MIFNCSSFIVTKASILMVIPSPNQVEQDLRLSQSQPQLHARPRPSARSVDLYEKLSQVGEGTYGQVYKAKNKETGEIVALKRIRMDNEKEGFPITAMREIKILQRVQHKNIVKLREIVTSRGSVYLVFEYLEHDLTGLVRREDINFTQSQIKCYMQQVLEGLVYLHSNNILHRDIKGSNLLLSNRGEVKLADFGLSRWYAEHRHYTNRVITLWYRPPELLLGKTQYGSEIDIWSVGCILVELFTKKPLFHGNDEMTQIDLIFRICGTPTDTTWPEFTDLPWYNTMKPKMYYPRRLREEIRSLQVPDAIIDILEKMLVVNPKLRISAEEALRHAYFTTDLPKACHIDELPIYPGDCHEYVTKIEKKRREMEDAEKVNSSR